MLKKRLIHRLQPRLLIFGVMAATLVVFGATVTMSQDNDCPDCDLKWANFDGQDLSGVILTGADLYRASFVGTNLTGADLTGAVLTWANLAEADLTNAQLIGADMTGATLDFAETEGAVTGASTTCPDGSDGPCDF